ncbi:MAG: YjjG family noncanonical pyrimidine nucleotidase [Clostridia bacterium]|nr:YjjG family noncanonical pyrimidine nucleotidase [Clostridia bacterium]
MIKTVFLDIDNTLFDFDECARLATVKAFREMGLPYQDDFFPVFMEENDKLWQEIEKGTLTREELHRVRFCRILKRLNIDADGIVMENLFLRYIEDPPVLIPGALELLAYLSPKYTLCLASNASEKRQKKRLAPSGILPFIDKIFLSESLGVPKPEKAFFDACFACLPGAGPETSIIIGDSLTADVLGGINSGMKTCWFNPKGLPLPETYSVDYTVASLKEIQKIL